MANNRSSNGRYNSNQSNNNNNNNQAPKKHSGCSHKPDKNGNPCTTGWNWSRRHGMMTFLCVVTKKSDVHKSGSGKEWINVMVIVSKEKEVEQKTNGLMDKASGKVIIDTMGMVLNPRAKNGGYCGRFGTK